MLRFGAPHGLETQDEKLTDTCVSVCRGWGNLGCPPKADLHQKQLLQPRTATCGKSFWIRAACGCCVGGCVCVCLAGYGILLIASLGSLKALQSLKGLSGNTGDVLASLKA